RLVARLRLRLAGAGPRGLSRSDRRRLGGWGPMTPEVQMQLLERLLAHLEAGTTDMAPSDVVVPGADYCSPERFQREQQRLFRRLPLVLAHASEVAKPGDFLTRDDYGVPLLVTRDQHGQLHAFLNTCTHRGARLT